LRTKGISNCRNRWFSWASHLVGEIISVKHWHAERDQAITDG